MSDDILEKISALEHDQWANWMRYMFDNYCDSMGLGCAVFTVPMPVYTRWLHQMKTSYEDLSEEDKEKDRKWAHKVLEVINNE